MRWPSTRGRGHVAAGLAEHPVVQQDAGDALAAAAGVQHLLQALVHHVAVALDREHDAVGLHRASRRSPPTARGRAAPARGRRRCSRTPCSSRCRARDRRAARTPSSCDRLEDRRMASGSPQPGHSVCSRVSSSSGFDCRDHRSFHGRSSCRSAAASARRRRERRRDPLADRLGVEQGPDAEARAVGGDAADGRPAHGRAPRAARRRSSGPRSARTRATGPHPCGGLGDRRRTGTATA